ncbi:ATP-binding protein [Luteitalea sp.]|uniref:two-component system sensor histidine kinase NtrB n=1 Tax=Luteitalea sp. TaxID=2004800 RepID=UPI0025C4F57A|nr:ATP-binding protein [Luteitalea sp.]
MQSALPLHRVLPLMPPWLAGGAALVALYPLARVLWGAPLADSVAAGAVALKLVVECASLLWASGRPELPGRLRVSLRVLGGTSALAATSVTLLEVVDWTRFGLPAVAYGINQYSALASYALYFVGFSLFPRLRLRREDAPVLWIDFAATVLGLGVLQWLLLTWPLLNVSRGTAQPVLTYAVAFLISASGLHLMIVWGRREPSPRAFWWLVGGLAAYLPVAFLAQLELAEVIDARMTSFAYFWGLMPTIIASVLIRHDPLPQQVQQVQPVQPTWWRTFNPLPLWTVAALGVTLIVAVRRSDERYTQVIAIALLVLAVAIAVRALLSGRENARLRREEALARERQAQAKAEAVGRLAGGIAHEFNNLLTTVVGFAELSGESLSPRDPVQKNLRYIRESADRAATLTRQLLQYSGQQMDFRRDADLAALVRSLAPTLRAGLPPGMRLTVEVLDSVVVRVDVDQLEQLLRELVTNSVTASEGEGDIVVSLSLQPPSLAGMHMALAPPAHACVLAVRDTGHGITPDVVPQIFDPFFSSAPRPLKTGLGLASVYGIVAAHGGGLGVTTAPGAGTSIYVFLPVVESLAHAADAAS